MNKNVFSILSFAAGAAAGAFVAWRMAKTKYERIAQEEIDSVKEVFGRKRREMQAKELSKDSTIDASLEEERTLELSSYSSLLDQLKYRAEHPEACLKIGKEGSGESSVAPYVISPDEFGDQEGYDTACFTYYADHILADDCDEVIDEADVDGLVGKESLLHIGEYEADAVHVRNEVTKTDYEILLDSRNYDDVPRTKAFDYSLADEDE